MEGPNKGSGVFGREVDPGSFLHIEVIRVEKKHRRKALASTLLKVLFDQVIKLEDSLLRFCFAYPACLGEDISDNLSETEQIRLSREAVAASTNLFRKAGFRRVGNKYWFAYAFDEAHPARSLAANDDYNPPKPAPPLSALLELEVALERKRTVIDHGMRSLDISDKFRGYTDADVTNLLKLRGITNPTPAQRAFAKYGCTCGECLSGWFSPRMVALIKIACEWENDQDMQDLDLYNSADQPIEDEYLLPPSWQGLPLRLRTHMKTNKGMRIGYRVLFGHIVKCLERKLAPTVANIKASVADSDECPPCCKHFVQSAGNVGIEVALRYAIEMSMEKDLKAGGGIDIIAEHEERRAKEGKPTKAQAIAAGGTAESYYKSLGLEDSEYTMGSIEWDEMFKEKECRNDSEFGFMFAMMTGKALA